jgi:hypothetical protein
MGQVDRIQVTDVIFPEWQQWLPTPGQFIFGGTSRWKRCCFPEWRGEHRGQKEQFGRHLLIGPQKSNVLISSDGMMIDLLINRSLPRRRSWQWKEHKEQSSTLEANLDDSSIPAI